MGDRHQLKTQSRQDFIILMNERLSYSDIRKKEKRNQMSFSTVVHTIKHHYGKTQRPLWGICNAVTLLSIELKLLK